MSFIFYIDDIFAIKSFFENSNQNENFHFLFEFFFKKVFDRAFLTDK